jgi:hypothetical protein
LVFLEKDMTLALPMLSFIQLAVHHPCTELMSDWSKEQSWGESTARKILISSAKSRNLEWVNASHMSLINTMKSRGPRTSLRDIWENFEMRGESTWNTDLRLPARKITAKPIYIATGKPKGTELMQKKRVRDKVESIAQIKVSGISLPLRAD